jgi:hypothetical protein
MRKSVEAIQRTFFLIALLLSLPSQAAGQQARDHFDWGPRDKEVQRFLFRLQLLEAERAIKDQDPGRPTTIYLHAQWVFASGLVNNDLEFPISVLDQAILKFKEERFGNHSWALLALAELYLYKATLMGLQENRRGAVLQAYQAHKYARLLEKNHPDFAPGFGMIGLMELSLASLPESYQKLAGLVGFKGTMSKGWQQLDAFIAFAKQPENQWLREKAAVMLIYSKHQMGESVTPVFSDLGLKLTGNPLASMIEARIKLDMGRGDLALNALKDCRCEGSFDLVPHLHFLRGRAYLTQLNPRASKDFERFLNLQKQGAFRHSAYRYLAWCGQLFGAQATDQVSLYQKNKDAAFALPTPKTGTDQQALRDLQRREHLNLLKARLLFDGGQWSLALESLQEMTPEQIVQHHNAYWYRMGRIHQKLGAGRQALEAYAKMSPQSADFEYANCLLQQALIFESAGQNEQAKAVLKALLRLKDYPNADSMQQKAKSALQRLSS